MSLKSRHCDDLFGSQVEQNTIHFLHAYDGMLVGEDSCLSLRVSLELFDDRGSMRHQQHTIHYNDGVETGLTILCSEYLLDLLLPG